jgi:hypothetical protein
MEKYRRRVLYAWPCGCREWRVEAIARDTIEEEELERYEPCGDLKALIARADAAEVHQVQAYLEHGIASPEHQKNMEAQGDLAAKMEEHTWEMTPTVEVLGSEAEEE